MSVVLALSIYSHGVKDPLQFDWDFDLASLKMLKNTLWTS